jgi:hypothetical protein
VSGHADTCLRCGHFQPARRPRAAAVASRATGYLLEAATLLPLFRMTMPDSARPTWPESWAIFAGLIVAAALCAGAGGRTPASRWMASAPDPSAGSGRAGAA